MSIPIERSATSVSRTVRTSAHDASRRRLGRLPRAGAHATVGADRAYDTRGFGLPLPLPLVAVVVVLRAEYSGHALMENRHGLTRDSGLTSSRSGGTDGRPVSRKTQFAAYLAGAAYDLLRVARLRECAV